MTEENGEAAELSRKFLTLRQRRRLAAHLDSSMVSLEQVREWEEGLAKYTELWLWQHAQADSTYHPANAAGNSARFGGYKDFGQHWTQEMITLRLQSRGGETRFYYAGMAEAFLLDRLLPGWRTRGLHTGVSLEELLGEATEQRRT